MIYDFTKGKSAVYFSNLISVDYNLDFDEFILSQSDLEYDMVGFLNRSKRNGLIRLGIFLPEFNDVKYGKGPALHIYNCDTTDELSRKMKVTSSSKNTFYSIDKRKEVTTTLEICKKCAKNIKKKLKVQLGLNTFNHFVLALEESDKKQMVVDNNGYILNWSQVSSCFRDMMNFTCEQCGFKAKDDKDRKFLHAHHIDRDKKNNKRSNLKCLCVKCHSEVDDHHQEKFAFEGLSQLQEFLNYLKK